MDIDPRFGEIEEIGPIEDLKDVRLEEEDPARVVKVGINLETTIKEALITFLSKNQDVFAWSHKDMVGIDPSISFHNLNIDSHFSPVQQKRRLLDKERSKALKEEVEKLRENGFIREAYYPSWVANPVLVPSQTESGEPVSTSLISTKPAPKTASLFQGSTSWSMLQQVTRYSLSWTPTLDTIKLRCIPQMKNTQASEHTWAFTATRSCLSI